MAKKNDNFNIIDYFFKFIASVCFIGYLPVAPGTLGSMAGLFLYQFIHKDPVFNGVFILISIILGLLTAGKVARLFEEKDPSEIIIDEFAGMLLSVYLLPATMGYMVSAFLLFRFFDIVKPKPISSLEKLKGSLGIMADDLMAGIYANVILQVIYRITLLF